MADTIHVKSAAKATEDGGFPVALWERDEAHPGGEVFIADDQAHAVARTPLVNAKLIAGTLVQVDARAKAKE